ncbi:beta-lactamase/transpeptidase-like protein [Xylariaceae sp. FL0662B]|nr:beta-lactamase/transpeptidase-like protein [Xylariaceae sp. FL0662B]
MEEGKEANPLADEGFRAFALEALRRWHVPGVAVAVVDGESTWAEGYGIATFPSTPVTSSTLFYTGSTTKAFTAAIVSLLIASGKYSIPSFSSSTSSSSSPSSSSPAFSTPLDWQTPIARLLGDDFVLMGEYEWANAHLTLEDALSHRTGFPRHDKALPKPSSSSSSAGFDGVREVTRRLRFLPATAEPRVRWRYCNLMFMVVSHAIQTLTGEWLGATMRRLLWAPLGMHATFLRLEDALRAREQLAAGYYWDYQRQRSHPGEQQEENEGFVEVPFADLDVASGAGGIISNVLDYAQWLRCLMREEDEDEDEDAPVLPREARRQLLTARTVMPPESRAGFDAPLAYALGWNFGTYRGHRVFTHGGGMDAYGAEVYFFPDLGYGVVTMANTALTSNFVGVELAWKLIDDRLGVPEGERFDWAGRSQKMLERKLAEPETAVQELYPDRADPPLPRQLPLEDYVGTYFHPAYRNVTIELIADPTRHPSPGADEHATGMGTNGKTEGGNGMSPSPRPGPGPGPELKAVRSDFEWPTVFEFRHVSGEFWAVVIDLLKVPNRLNGQLARAEFKIGVRGRVEALEMEFLEEGSEGVIAFQRVA